MPSPLELRGLVASPGYASGHIWNATHSKAPHYVPKSSPQLERRSLADAIGEARAQSAALVAAAKADAADILEFQLAVLEDETFANRAYDLITQSKPADLAWLAVLDEEIETYQDASEEYFRARATDLRDIRDRVLAVLTGAAAPAFPEGSIVVAEDLTPSQFLSHNWAEGGLVMQRGSAQGHVAMLARQQGVPAIVGTKGSFPPETSFGLLDAEAGLLIVNPDADAQSRFRDARARYVERRRAEDGYATQTAMTRSGRPVSVMVNVADPQEVRHIPLDTADGVGLMRTEFLFNEGPPDEETQYQAYRTVLEWAQGKPVVIRTVDAGADKPVPGLTTVESNSFLGMRGIRLSLTRPEIFRVQVRALLRAAAHGNLKVMLPMVSVPEELEQAVELFRQEAANLRYADTPHAVPPIGVMVEVPAVALAPDRFAAAAFFSIGTNDLTQYVFAAARDNAAVSALARPRDPVVLDLIRNVTRYAASVGKDVSVCGDVASEPEAMADLLRAGVSALSVAANAIGKIKASISRFDDDGIAERSQHGPG